MPSPLIFIFTSFLVLTSISLFIQALFIVEKTVIHVQQQKKAEIDLLTCTEIITLKKNLEEAQAILLKNNKAKEKEIKSSTLNLINQLPIHKNSCENNEMPRLLGMPYYQKNDINLKNWPNWVSRLFFKNV